ncbi:hypothetical protein DL96DRAFT_1825300 [Flagelloscypha sp. PMI_526]|nr:hypothetical protein DL96DRAFT_1825300 [Flagelloscypha sp. PMI_526]
MLGERLSAPELRQVAMLPHVSGLEVKTQGSRSRSSRMGAYDLTVGGLLLGLSLKQVYQSSLYFYGIVSCLYWAYITLKFRDPVWLRVIVAALFVIDTFQTIAEFYEVWHLAVENYANPNIKGVRHTLLPLSSASTAVCAFIVQIFLISRLWRLTNLNWLGGILVFVSFGTVVESVIHNLRVYTFKNLSQLRTIVPFVITSHCLEVFINMTITTVLSWTLWRTRTGFSRTNTIIHRCIVSAIQTGFFSSLFAIGNLVTFALYSQTFLWAVFNWPLGKIYSISLLYTLVARKELAAIADEPTELRTSRSPGLDPIVIHKNVTTVSSITDDDGHKPRLDNLGTSGIPAYNKVQYLTTHDWPQVVPYVDAAPQLSQEAVVKHFASRPPGHSLPFNRSSLSWNISGPKKSRYKSK